jgi:hypothetical protein
VQKVGEAWKTGRYITLSLTIMYHIDHERGQVCSAYGVRVCLCIAALHCHCGGCSANQRAIPCHLCVCSALAGLTHHIELGGQHATGWMQDNVLARVLDVRFVSVGGPGARRVGGHPGARGTRGRRY